MSCAGARLTLPARGMRKGSVQKTALRARFSSDALTAMESSMGSSGGMTLVMIMVQLSSSLKRSLSGFCTAHGNAGEPSCRAEP